MCEIDAEHVLGELAEIAFAVPGEDFECIFTSQNGHPKASDVSVKLDNAAFDGYTYSEET